MKRPFFLDTLIMHALIASIDGPAHLAAYILHAVPTRYCTNTARPGQSQAILSILSRPVQA